jgi:hypothetical protein
MKQRVWFFIGLLGALVVISAAFFQYLQENKEIPNNPENMTSTTTTISYPTITPTNVVTAFFSWYQDENNKLPNTSYKTVLSLTEDFKEKINSILSAGSLDTIDPLSCTEDGLFDSFVAERAQILGTESTVAVTTREDGEENSLIVELSLFENAWKIKNILCFIKG